MWLNNKIYIDLIRYYLYNIENIYINIFMYIYKIFGYILSY